MTNKYLKILLATIAMVGIGNGSSIASNQYFNAPQQQVQMPIPMQQMPIINIEYSQYPIEAFPGVSFSFANAKFNVPMQHFIGLYNRAVEEEQANMIRQAQFKKNYESSKTNIPFVHKIQDVLFYLPNYSQDYIQRIIVNTLGFYEQDVLNQLDQYIPDNSVVLDVGANIGNHTLYWAIKRNAQKVYSFEPVHDTFKILKKNIELNDLKDKVSLFEIGLSDERTNAKITVFNPSNIGATHIGKCEVGDMQIDKLDNIEIKEKVDFVKIDVEGHEHFVLRGGAEFFKKQKPAIFIESFDEQYPETARILDIYGYKLEKTFPDDNYLFVPKSQKGIILE